MATVHYPVYKGWWATADFSHVEGIYCPHCGKQTVWRHNRILSTVSPDGKTKDHPVVEYADVTDGDSDPFPRPHVCLSCCNTWEMNLITEPDEDVKTMVTAIKSGIEAAT